MDWKSMGQWFNSTFGHCANYYIIKMNIQTIKFLNKLKNASLINNEFITVDSNKFIHLLLKFLYKEGFILSFKIKEKDSFHNNTTEALVILRYFYNKPIFRDLKIISSPSKNTVLSYRSLSRITSKKNILVFSTIKGLLSLDECKKFKVGGILLFIC